MIFSIFKNTVLLLVLLLVSCGNLKQEHQILDTNTEIAVGVSDTNSVFQNKSKILENNRTTETDNKVVVGANRVYEYLPLLKTKRVGVVANQTSVIFKESHQQSFTHIVDSLLAHQINIKSVFAPEHGFRGDADAGEYINDDLDNKTGLPIISLYGNNKKPTPKQLENIDLLIFDIQDVGVRFYTYISTLHYIMEACAENKIPLLILDRPNPNAHYIDGPILEPQYQSFVGMHPVPVVHGMTIAEYAQMINGQGWLTNGLQCELIIIPVKNYTHQTPYSLPIKPSPNLPNDRAVNLYPSLCFFEGTTVSVGRGTDKPFQIFGSPYLNTKTPTYNYKFIPQPNPGAKNPKHINSLCYGMDLSTEKRLKQLDLNYLVEAYKASEKKADFFNKFFTNLTVTNQLQTQIETGKSVNEIKKTWYLGLKAYNAMRQPYLIYE